MTVPAFVVVMAMIAAVFVVGFFAGGNPKRPG